MVGIIILFIGLTITLLSFLFILRGFYKGVNTLDITEIMGSHVLGMAGMAIGVFVSIIGSIISIINLIAYFK